MGKSHVYGREQRRLGALAQRLGELARYEDDDFRPFEPLMRLAETKAEAEWLKRQRRKKINRARDDIKNLERKLGIRGNYWIMRTPIGWVVHYSADQEKV